MKKIWFIFTCLLLATGAAFSQPQGLFGHRQGKVMNELKLTDAQQEAFDKTRYETQKKQIELRAKAATARLDLQKLMAADSPDKSAIEKKYNEIASLNTAMKMNHFNAWFENNKVLTPEQQKIWKKVLTNAPGRMGRGMSDMRRHRFGGEMPMR